MKNSTISVVKILLTGGFIGLIIVSIFVFSVKNPPEAWGPNWRLKPLILTPAISAVGALSFYLKDLILPSQKFYKGLIVIASVLIFLFVLWIGIVLGLSETLWD